MGVGGLGHLAIQFAAKMGCDVVVLSGSNRKKDEAMKLGAKHFHATKGAKELKLDRPINHLLVTTSVQPDWNLILPVMAPGGMVSLKGTTHRCLRHILIIPFCFGRSTHSRSRMPTLKSRTCR